MRDVAHKPLFAAVAAVGACVAKRPTRLLTVLALLVCALLTCAAGALAAAPAVPLMEATSGVTATSAVLHGVLSPSQEGELGTTYEFAYRASQTECLGGVTTPEPPGASLGFEHEEVTQELSGLEAHTEYTACLIARNGAQSSTSAPVKFKTTETPEAPEVEPATVVTATTAVLHGVLNPSAEGEGGTYHFIYSASRTSCTGPERAVTEPASAAGAEREAASAEIVGLLPNTTYSFCLAGVNSAGEEAQSPSVAFTTKTSAPSVAKSTVSAIGGSSATVNATINPGGLSTSYRAELVTEEEFLSNGWAPARRVPSPDAQLPAGGSRVGVGESLGSLTPSTRYRVRFSATNALGESAGEEAEFTTPGPTSAGSPLPDGRAYELVSTSGRFGEPYSPTSPQTAGESYESNQTFQAAEGGDAVTYIAEPSSPAGGNGNVGSNEGDQWLAQRTPAGWTTANIDPEFKKTAYEGFSPDLSAGVLFVSAEAPLAPLAPADCIVLYSRSTETGAYTAITTASQAPGDCGQSLYAGESSTGGKVIFQNEAALTPNASEATEVPPGHPEGHPRGYGDHGDKPCMFGCNLYAEEGGHLSLISVLPDGTPVSNASFGGYPGANPGAKTVDRINLGDVISADGSRIFWTDTQPGADMEHVFVSENGTTFAVSGGEPAEFWAASRDGRYAYYTENHELWVFDTASNTRERLAGPGAGVEGVIGTNVTGQPGEYLYFVASGVLATNETKAGQTAVEGSPNLYLRHGTSTSFIATLSPEDDHIDAFPQGEGEDRGDWVANLGDRTAELTPNGQQLVFQSVRSLTGFRNLEGSGLSIEPISEAFVFDADTASLSCVSCNPDGAASHQETANLAVLPVSSESDVVMRRWMSDDGRRVFFQSSQPLVPGESNAGVEDVYEWEAVGEGSCTDGAASLPDDGCVFLLSGGESEDSSYFVDADASGENVFLEHHGSLGAAIVEGQKNELYDARVGGGFSPTQIGCTGSQCQGPQPLATGSQPPSVTAPSGSNLTTVVATSKKTSVPSKAKQRSNALKACRRKRQKSKRQACERLVNKRFGKPKSATKVNRPRRKK